jgi:hypothetical protein
MLLQSGEMRDAGAMAALTDVWPFDLQIKIRPSSYILLAVHLGRNSG